MKTQRQKAKATATATATATAKGNGNGQSNGTTRRATARCFCLWELGKEMAGAATTRAEGRGETLELFAGPVETSQGPKVEVSQGCPSRADSSLASTLRGAGRASEAERRQTQRAEILELLRERGAARRGERRAE